MTGTVWVTGAAGFTARHLLDFLAGLAGSADRPRVVALDIAEAQPPGADACHRVDLNDADAVCRVARKEPPRWVVHLAGAMPPASEAQMWLANVGGTCGLLAGLAAAGCRDARVISVSSAAEYHLGSDQPILETTPLGPCSPYGRTKMGQSLAALGAGRTFGLETMVVRPFNLIGPGLPSRLVAGRICEQIAASDGEEEIVLGNTKSARDFVDVRDAVGAYWLLALRGAPGEVYNVCSGRATSIDEMLTILRELTGKALPVRVDGDRIRKTDPAVVVGDATKLRRATAWEAKLSLRQSLADMLAAPASYTAGSAET